MCFGKVNLKCLEEEKKLLRDLYDTEEDLSRMKEISDKGDMKFRKTRQGVEKECIKKSKQIVAKGLKEHWEFEGAEGDLEKLIISQFSKFKPRKTFFESKEGKLLKNNEKVVSAIEKLKAIRDRGVTSERVKREVMAKNGIDRETFFELDEQEVKQMTERHKVNLNSGTTDFRKDFYIPTEATNKMDLSSFVERPSDNRSVFQQNSHDTEWKMISLTEETGNLVKMHKRGRYRFATI